MYNVLLEPTRRWAMIRWAHALLRSGFRVSIVSSCTTRPCCFLGVVVVQGDYRRTCRTSRARLAMLPAPWEGHFRDSAEAAGDRGKADKPFSVPESLGETGSTNPILPRPLCRGGEECGPSGEESPAEIRPTAKIRTDGPSRSSVREWLT